MHPCEIDDWQFGRLVRDDNFRCWTTMMGWRDGSKLELCLRTELTDTNSLPERARVLFDRLWDHEEDLISLLPKRLIKVIKKLQAERIGKHPEQWPKDLAAVRRHLRLLTAVVGPDDGIEIDYALDGGPLLRVFLKPDFTFKEAYLD